MNTVIHISKSLYNPNKLGYIVELPQYSDFDPTFDFTEDQLEHI